MFNVANVAPRVGAWIETISPNGRKIDELSHPVWVRGLKLSSIVESSPRLESHPVWVRGLKQKTMSKDFRLTSSHPVWVRGLKRW